MRFSEGLEKIGLFAFYESGLEQVELPGSLRVVAQGAFARCASLRTAEFCEGLEALGTVKYPVNGGFYYGVFQESSLRSVKLPKTLKKVENNAFTGCRNFKGLVLPENVECIGRPSFQESVLGSISV